MLSYYDAYKIEVDEECLESNRLVRDLREAIAIEEFICSELEELECDNLISMEAAMGLEAAENLARRMKEASEKLTAAQKSGDKVAESDALAEMAEIANQLESLEKSEQDEAKKRKIRRIIGVGLAIIGSVALAFGGYQVSKHLKKDAVAIKDAATSSVNVASNNAKTTSVNVGGKLKLAVGKLKTIVKSGPKTGTTNASTPAQNSNSGTKAPATPPATSSSTATKNAPSSPASQPKVTTPSAPAPSTKSNSTTGATSQAQVERKPLTVTYNDKQGKQRTVTIKGTPTNYTNEQLKSVVKNALTKMGIWDPKISNIHAHF